MKHKIMSIVHHNLQTSNNLSPERRSITLKKVYAEGPSHHMLNIKKKKKHYLNYHGVGTTRNVHLLESLEKA